MTRFSRFGFPVTAAATALASLVVGCGSSAGSGGTPGTGGTPGLAGTTGAAGTSGAAGVSGAAGTGGEAGSGAAGTSGTAGSSGAAGTSGRGGTGVAGAGGTAGSAGRGGAGGTSAGAGSTGAAGTSASGRGGTSGSAGTGGSAAGSAGSTGSGGAPFKGVANSPCAARKLLTVSWFYNWTETIADTCSDGGGGEFVPMIWGHTGNEQSASGITSAVSSFVGKGYAYVLGFNEPDNTGQANLSVATAISLWPSFDNPAIKIGTAATSANSNGQSWFSSYLNMVNASSTTLRADFIAMHWYGWNAGSCDAKASQLESYIKFIEGFSGNRPIWITEWGCLNDSAPDTQTVVSFFNGALAVFARHPRIQRYAWYPWSTNNELNNSDGSLTDLGQAYAAAPAYK